MVKLRLRRLGRKKLPIYKIVAADSRSPRDGGFIEAVGTYNPNFNPAQVDLKETRVLYWLKNGAQPTYTVKNLLSRKGILLKVHLTKKGADEQKIEQELSKLSDAQAGKIYRESEKRLRRKEKRKKAKKQGDKPAEATATPA